MRTLPRVASWHDRTHQGRHAQSRTRDPGVGRPSIYLTVFASSTGQQTCCNAGLAAPQRRPMPSTRCGLAAANGVRVFRFFANLWGPNCVFAAQHPGTFWREMDSFWDEIDRLGLFAIPSLGAHDWHYATQNETINDLVMDRNSKSRKYAVDYIRTFTTSYINRSSLFFWELGNELNLLVDLPSPHCHPTQQCFNTQSMVDFQDALARVIRAAEMHPASKSSYGPRPISSGFSAPRPSAWHQAHFMPHDPHYWDKDSLSQWLDMLQMQNAESIDVWSMHMYDNENGSRNVSMLSAAVLRARAQGKMLFLGEYGGNGPNFTGPAPSSSGFPKSVLILRSKTPKMVLVVLLCLLYGRGLVHPIEDMVCIWPGEPDGRKETVQMRP